MRIDFGNFRIPAVTLVANEFIDRYMPSANGEYVKVYLYLLRHAGEEVGQAEIADALELTEGDVRRALIRWQRDGLLTAEETGTVTEKAEPVKVPAQEEKTQPAAAYPVESFPVLFIGYLNELTHLSHFAERCSFFYLKTVARDVFRAESDYFIEIVKRIITALARYRKHQVKIDIVKALSPDDLHVAGNVFSGVYASQIMQPVVVHRLHAHGEPVYAHESVRLQLC